MAPKPPKLTEDQKRIIERLLPLKTWEYIAVEAHCTESQARYYAKKYLDEKIKQENKEWDDAYLIPERDPE